MGQEVLRMGVGLASSPYLSGLNEADCDGKAVIKVQTNKKPRFVGNRGVLVNALKIYLN